MKNVLITGFAGFIGSNLSRRLISEGDTVIAYDDYSTGTREAACDIASIIGPGSLRSIDHECSLDRIYHLASPAAPSYYQGHQVEMCRTAYIETDKALDAAWINGSRMLFASSSAVYGSSDLFDEGFVGCVSTTNKDSSYVEGKRFGEAICAAYHREYEVDVRIARFFPIYGPGMRIDDGRVIPNFIVAALRNEPIIITGGGDQVFTQCYIGDALEAMVRLMELDLETSSCEKEENEPFILNIGSVEPVSVTNLAKLIVNLCGSSSEIRVSGVTPINSISKIPSLGKTKRCIDWEPTTGLFTGLSETIEWFRSII